jgi:translation initiation factor 2B subunit (eIF-2B alpha/beta/delta family)
MELLLESEHIQYYNQDLHAKSAVSAVFHVISSAGNEPLKKAIETRKAFIEKHPHNIVLKNSLDYFFSNLTPGMAKERHDETITKITAANRELAEIGAKKIKKGSTVFVHSVNNQVLETLFHASRANKFTINILEHSPLFFGKHLSAKLKKHNIRAKVFSDISIKDAVIHADTCLIGADSITKDGTYAKTGSVAAAAVANRHHIPVYVLGHSYKYDHKQKIKLHEHRHENHSLFEFLPNEDIKSYICEHGIFKPRHIYDEILFFNKWMLLH